MQLDEIRDEIIGAIAQRDEIERRLIELTYTDDDLWKAVGGFGAVHLVLNKLPNGECFHHSEIVSHCNGEFGENGFLVFDGFMEKLGEFASLRLVTLLTVSESPDDILFVHPDYKNEKSP